MSQSTVLKVLNIPENKQEDLIDVFTIAVSIFSRKNNKKELRFWQFITPNYWFKVPFGIAIFFIVLSLLFTAYNNFDNKDISLHVDVAYLAGFIFLFLWVLLFQIYHLNKSYKRFKLYLKDSREASQKAYKSYKRLDLKRKLFVLNLIKIELNQYKNEQQARGQLILSATPL